VEIRPDVNLKRAGKVQPKKGKKENLKNSVSFNDKVTLGEEKPGEMKEITPGSAGVSQEKKTSPALAGSYLQNAAASATLSGSLGAAMQNINAENLQKQLRIYCAPLRLKIMGKLEESFRDTTYRERAEVLTGLLKHEYSENALKDFEFIKAHTGKKEKLADVGKTFVDLLSAAGVGCYSSQKTRKAFKYTRDKLKNDPSKIRSFTRILEKSKSYKDTVKIYEHIQKPVKNEDYKIREKVALRLMELELVQWQWFKKVYDTIGRHIYSGEDLKKVTEQFVAIYQAQGNNSYSYEKSLEAFTDMKEKSKTDRKSFDRYINVLKVLKDVDRTKEAMNLLNRPVKNESYDDREAILLEQNKTLQDSDNFSKEAIENYRVISSKIDKSETLKQANFRFRKLSDVLDGRKNPEKVRDAFSFIADEMKDGTFPGKSVKEVTDMLVKALLVSDSLSDAKDYLIHQQNPGKDGKIEKEDGFVVIGGVKLPVRN